MSTWTLRERLYTDGNVPPEVEPMRPWDVPVLGERFRPKPRSRDIDWAVSVTPLQRRPDAHRQCECG